LYIEGFAGLKPYIDFKEVKASIESWAALNNTDPAKIVIAKAEMRMTFEYPEDYTRFTYYPSQLFLCTREERGTGDKKTIIYDPLEDISYYETNGSINRSLLYYSLDISSYLQRVLQGKHTGKSLETYLFPILKQSDYYSGAVYYYVQNTLYGKAVLNGRGMTRKPKLVLTYTVMP
jgi:hypothetical protein